MKIHRRLPRDSYFALMEEAKKQKLDVAGHIPMEVRPEEASDTGQAILTHTETLFEGTFAASLKEGELPAAIRRFRTDGAQIALRPFREERDCGDTHPRCISINPRGAPAGCETPTAAGSVALSLRKAAENAKPLSPSELEEVRQTYAELREVVRQMHASGVVLIAGTGSRRAADPGIHAARGSSSSSSPPG